MGLIASASKAIRLLASRRYTSGDLTTAQEAFTSVLDISADEIYIQQNLLPSTGLPFSGSSQNRSTYTTGGKTVLKYWYRHPLTKSNVDRDVWFFVNPSGSTDGVTPQLIQSGQLTSFTSNKYSDVSLTNAVAEDATPGYNIVVYKSTATDTSSLDSGDKVSINDYQFDYKTGVLQFDANKPGASDRIYMTTYQYVGQTLATNLSTGNTNALFTATGSAFSTGTSGTDVQVTGSLYLKGDLTIENLGTLANRDSAGILDFGDDFN